MRRAALALAVVAVAVVLLGTAASLAPGQSPVWRVVRIDDAASNGWAVCGAPGAPEMARRWEREWRVDGEVVVTYKRPRGVRLPDERALVLWESSDRQRYRPRVMRTSLVQGTSHLVFSSDDPVGVRLDLTDASGSRLCRLDFTVPNGENGLLSFGLPLAAPIEWLDLDVDATSTARNATATHRVSVHRSGASRWRFSFDPIDAGVPWLDQGHLLISADRPRPPWRQVRLEYEVRSAERDVDARLDLKATTAPPDG